MTRPATSHISDASDSAEVSFMDLAELADHLRAVSIRMTDRADSGHPTSSMSAADIVAVLIARHLRIDPAWPDVPGNDRLVFSKGHASPLLYGALEAIGVFDDLDVDLIDDYRRLGSVLEGHPTSKLPGVHVATGSLGLGIAMGVGMAIAHRRLDSLDAHVWVLCGDSELAEGAVWEAVEHAGSAGLAGLTAMLDVNRLGQTGETRHGWDTDEYEQRFSAFGWATTVVDGHDVEAIDSALADARRSETPTALIARTHKGAGADETDDAEGKHGQPLDDPDAAIADIGGIGTKRVEPPRPTTLRTGSAARVSEHATGTSDRPTWVIGDELATRDAFGDAIVAIGKRRPDVVALDGEVSNSTRLAGFAEEFPDRFFQMYVAEQLMVGAAIGLRTLGWTPFVATFGAFLTRAHDVLRMAAIGRNDLRIIGSHAGVSIGEDGPSQMGLEDLAMMRSVAGSTVLSPSDAVQTVALVDQMVDRPGISYLRTMRGDTPVLYEPSTEFPIGGSVVAHRPDDDATVTIVATGVTVHEALSAARLLDDDDIAAEVLDVYSIKPIDVDALLDAAARTGRFVVVEDHRPEGGLGDAVANALLTAGSAVSFAHLAVHDLPGSATPSQQRSAAGIDADAIVRVIREAG